MALGITNVIGIGKETTRGVVAASAFQLPIMGDGFTPRIEQAIAGVVDSASFPWMREGVPMGRSFGISVSPTPNVDTIADILGLALARTAGVLPSVSFKELLTATLKRNWLGCVCSSLGLEFSREELLTARMEFTAMSNATGDGAAGTQPVGNRFKLHASSFTLNSVAATRVLSMSYDVTNTLFPAEPGSSLNIAELLDGGTEQEFRLTANFDSLTWRALIEGATQFDAEIVLATGTADETVTMTIAAAQLASHAIGGGGDIVTQDIVLRPFSVDNGATPPVAFATGLAIGASQLSLTLPS